MNLSWRLLGNARWCGKEYTAGGPVAVLPVGFVKVGDSDTSAAGRMGKLAFAQVNTNVACFVREPEENQVTGGQFVAGYFFAREHLISCGSRQRKPKDILENNLHETRAIYAALVRATHNVGRTFPALCLAPQVALYLISSQHRLAVQRASRCTAANEQHR